MLYLQQLWGGLCKSALQSPENGESKMGVRKKKTFFIVQAITRKYVSGFEKKEMPCNNLFHTCI